MIYETDPWLAPYKDAIDARHRRILDARADIEVGGSLSKGLNNHLYYGMHRTANGDWIFREWAPNATKIYLIGDFNNWKRTEAYALKPVGNGNWEIEVSSMFISDGTLYKLYIEWPGGGGERIPAYATRAVQDPETKLFVAQVWDPAKPYRWKHKGPGKREHPFIYECHIGMSSEEEKVSTFNEFRENVLPKIIKDGYDTIQIMALQEHPYYGSFGYQVSNFYALSSRFGTPEDFKALVDEAHGAGIAVVMDIVHSHSVDNELEGLGDFDGKAFTPEHGKYYYTSGTLYAAQTIGNIPESDGRRIQIAWGRVSHPGMPFNGTFLIPTELSLRTGKDGIRLYSKPVKEFESIQTKVYEGKDLTQQQADEAMKPYAGADVLRVKATISLSHATSAGLSFRGQNLLDYDMNGTRINGVFYSPEDMTSMELSFDMYIDRTLVEAFIDGGAYSYSMEFRPSNDGGFSFWGNNVTVKSLEVYTLESIWE